LLNKGWIYRQIGKVTIWPPAVGVKSKLEETSAPFTDTLIPLALTPLTEVL